MKFLGVGGASQIHRLMSVCLYTGIWTAMVDFPRSVPIPYGPCSIGDREASLKSFAHAPLGRVVLCVNLDVASLFPPGVVIDGEQDLLSAGLD